MNAFSIGGRSIGPDFPCYVIAEAGINHNGDLETAKRLVEVAADTGCDAVKFQKRTPKLCVPKEQQGQVRETPWGTMTYLEYKERTELSAADFEEIGGHAAKCGIQWFASPWDVPSLKTLVDLGVPAIKVASASVTNLELLSEINATGLPTIMSTGMSDFPQIRRAIAQLDQVPLALLHTVSVYPCAVSNLNLRMIETLQKEFGLITGYSGHEIGLPPSLAAVALGASIIERHITLSRAMWGTDHPASVEPSGMRKLVSGIRSIESALGDGEKKVLEEELVAATKLRVNQSAATNPSGAARPEHNPNTNTNTKLPDA